LCNAGCLTVSRRFIDGNNAYQGSDADRNGTFFGKVAQDTIRLYTHFFETDGAWQTLLPNSTIVVAANGSITPSIVGVGAESTVLKDLANRDMITGRMYSLYIGQGFDRANGAVNGSNTFGGYDAGRFKGDVHQYQMRPTINPFNVRVKDIVISDTNNPNGNTSLFNPSTAIFDAQITTDQFPLSLPYDVTQNFIKHMNAEQNNDWGDNSLKLKNPTTSTLSIVLEDGFTITLPPEMLANKSNITPIQNRDQNSTAPFLLSSAFLSQVYLMADYESYQFYLATAVQKNNAVMPTPWCPKSIPTAYERPKQSTFLQQGLIGAVIGGIVGGIALIAFAYCFVIALLRRRDEKKLEWNLENGKRETKMAQFQVEDVPEFDPPPKKAMMKFWGKI
jgi:hypothetical protein